MADAVGLDAHEVIRAANFNYPRSRVAQPGLVGGPCLEKDTYILAEGLESYGYTPEIVMQARHLNENVIGLAVDRIAQTLKQKSDALSAVKKICVLGLAFKGEPETGDVRGSLAVPLFKRLEEKFPQADVIGYDSVATPEEAARWGITNVAPTLQEALRKANIVIIQNNHAAFKGDAPKPLMPLLAKGAVLYDFWNSTSASLSDGTQVTHIGLGMGRKHHA